MVDGVWCVVCTVSSTNKYEGWDDDDARTVEQPLHDSRATAPVHGNVPGKSEQYNDRK